MLNFDGKTKEACTSNTKKLRKMIFKRTQKPKKGTKGHGKNIKVFKKKQQKKSLVLNNY